MIKVRYLICLMIFIGGPSLVPLLSGQQIISSVKKLSTDDGFNGQIKYSALIDKDGFLWMTSAYGLDRYDGNEVLNITLPHQDRKNEEILDLYETENGEILLFTGGLFFINDFSNIRKDIRIYNVNAKSGQISLWNIDTDIQINFSDIRIYSKGVDGLNILLKNGDIWNYKRQWQKIGKNKSEDLYQSKCLFNIDGSSIYAKNRELIKANKYGEITQRKTFAERIINMYSDTKGQYQILTIMNQVIRSYLIDEAFNVIEQYNQQIATLPYRQKTPDGNILFQQNGKIELRNKENKVLINYSDLLGLNENENGLNYQWVYQSTYSNTIILQSFEHPYIINRVSSPFKNLLSDTESIHSMRGICTSPNGDIFANAGVRSFLFDQFGNLKETLINPLADKWRFLSGHTCHYDPWQNSFWVVSPSGIYEYEIESKRKTPYLVDLDARAVKMITGKELKHPYILTENGLFEFNRNCDCIKKVTIDSRDHPLNSNIINELIIFNDKRFILNKSGLFIWEEEQNKITKEYPLPDDLKGVQILDVHLDDANNIWLATKGAGVIHWKLDNNQIKIFSTTQGLSRDVVYSIKKDGKGRFWLPTTYGLNCLDPISGVTRNYLPKDGLPHYEFNTHSFHQDDQGKMYFGGLNGFTILNPDSINTVSTADPNTMITQVALRTIENDEITIQNPNSDQPILFNSGRDILEVKFSTININNTSPPKFQYKFEETGEPWQNYSGTSLTFTNLNPGNYTLKIRGKDGQNSWSKKSVSLNIKVPTPFFQSLWFWSLVTFMLLAAGFLYARWRLNRLQKSRLKLVQEVEKRTLSLQQSKKLIEVQATELKNLDRLKSRFFTNISHELRTPLTLILNPLKAIRKNNYGTEGLKEQIDTAHSASHQLQNLIERILRLSDVNAENLKLRQSNIPLSLIMDQMILPYRSAAESLGLHFKLEPLNNKDLIIEVDVEKLKEIIDSLISNALKFCVEGDKITLGLNYKEELLTFICKDTGIGIDAKDQEKIFAKYYQVSNSDIPTQGGLGIGLPVAQVYAKIMQGHLVCFSKPNEGSTFTLSVPCKTAVKASEFSLLPTATIGSTPTEIITPPKNEHLGAILLVEDHGMMNKLVANILKPNYKVISAANGKKAIDILTATKGRSQKVDLIITDWMMPQMDGPTFLKAIKSNKDISRVPIIMLTARASQADKLSMLQIGVDDYLIKPFDPEELKIRVLNLLDNHRERKEEYKHQKTMPNPSFKLEPTVDEKWLQQLEQEVTTHLSNTKYTIIDLAKAMNIGERQLNRRIKSLTGLTPGNYIKECRLLKARHLLENRQLYTVSEVCFAVGFSTQEYFTKIYYQRFGKLPSSYIS